MFVFSELHSFPGIVGWGGCILFGVCLGVCRRKKSKKKHTKQKKTTRVLAHSKQTTTKKTLVFNWQA